MKNIKLSIISTLALGLVTGSSVGVAAQEETANMIDPCATPITAVSGTIYWGSTSDEDPAVVVEGVTHRKTIHISRWDIDDDRLDGDQEFKAIWDMDGETGIHSGTIRIVNADGAWSGTVQGVGPSIGSWQEFVDLSGEGAYEGLSASVFARSGSSGTVEGSIYPTDLTSCDFTSIK